MAKDTSMRLLGVHVVRPHYGEKVYQDRIGETFGVLRVTTAGGQVRDIELDESALLKLAADALDVARLVRGYAR